MEVYMSRSPSFMGWPSQSWVTPGPSLAITPAPSWPAQKPEGGKGMLMSPRQRCRSEPQMPAWVMRSRTAPGSGSGASYSSMTKGLVYSFRMTTRPFMHPPRLRCGAMLCQGHAGVKKQGRLRLGRKLYGKQRATGRSIRAGFLDGRRAGVRDEFVVWQSYLVIF